MQVEHAAVAAKRAMNDDTIFIWREFNFMTSSSKRFVEEMTFESDWLRDLKMKHILKIKERIDPRNVRTT